MPGEAVAARLCVIGGWHQAAVLGACLAEAGHSVTGAWTDAAVIAGLRAGRAPLHEPGLDELLAQQHDAGRLRYTSDYAEALRCAEFAFLAIDTPVAEDDAPELEVVFDTAVQIGSALSGDIVLCITAQVPVGTSERVASLVNEAAPGWRCDVVYVPEFLRLGTALQSFREADRFVIGSDDAEVVERVAQIYAGTGRPVVRTDLRSAEMAKHACNAFLATSISFINEIANLCEATGARAADVVRVMKLDRRIGAHAFLTPGLGFAGGTLGRDVRTLQALGAAAHRSTPVLDSVMQVNDARAVAITDRLEHETGGLHGARVGILGLTYKAGTSTLRRSIALQVIGALVARGAEVRACDPLADFTDTPDLPDFAMCGSALEAAEGADALLLLTEWEALRDLDLGELSRRMRRPLLLDTRGFVDGDAARRAGLRYLAPGQGAREVETTSAGVPA